MIPLVDLKAQYCSIKAEIDEAIQRVLINSSFILGEEVKSFEEAFAAFCNVEYAIGTCSGTSALHLALLACGVGPGDEVITTPFTFIATAEAISYTGARPVFVDIDPVSYCLDPSRLEAAITPKTKAILPVHLYGQPAEMEAILEIANHYKLRVIEDAAQAHGAKYKDRHAGTIGDVGCFSFYPGKNLGAYGDGGLVITNNSEIAHQVRLLRNHGRIDKYEHLIEGYAYRLDALQAAILKVKLRYLEQWSEARRQHARQYDSLLKGARVSIPQELDNAWHVYHLYVVQAENRTELQQGLKTQGIATGIHYPIPLHLQPAYHHFGYQPGDFPVTETVCQKVLSLPMYPELTDEQVSAVATAIDELA
jgi:dTDP-4-amino-4,6-dideoxygalactose transaminase